MASVLLIHRDHAALVYLASVTGTRHQVRTAADVGSGIRNLGHPRPDVVVIHHDQHREALRLLEYFKANVMKVPVVVLLAPRAATDQALLMKMGVRVFLEPPFDADRLDRGITQAIDIRREADAGPPPITPEEQNANLSSLENRLNKAMKCVSGRNQVFLQSWVLGRSTTRPRILLKCPLRPQYGLPPHVYYEHIRDVCCGDPNRCEAYRRFSEERQRGVAGL